MTVRQTSLLAVLAAILVSSGCASTSTSPARVDSQAQFVPKAIPTLSDQERRLLSGNGYAFGKWSEKCGDAGALQERYYADGDKVMSEVTAGGKPVRRSELYDVREVSKGVIRLKNYGKDFSNGQEFISETKSGVSGNKKMIFDQSLVFLGGQTAGEELVLLKDGYELTGTDGSAAKGKRAPIWIQCE